MCPSPLDSVDVHCVVAPFVRFFFHSFVLSLDLFFQHSFLFDSGIHPILVSLIFVWLFVATSWTEIVSSYFSSSFSFHFIWKCPSTTKPSNACMNWFEIIIIIITAISHWRKRKKKIGSSLFLCVYVGSFVNLSVSFMLNDRISISKVSQMKWWLLPFLHPISLSIYLSSFHVIECVATTYNF